MRNLCVSVLAAVLFGAGSLCGQGLPTPQGMPVDVLPDFVPVWESYSLQDIRIDAARSNDRLVSCEDWTQVDPNPITGQRVLSFTLGSPNYGIGHFRTRREMTPDGWAFYQTTSLLNLDGTCSSTEQLIGVVPADQAGRWLPLAQFTLYEVTPEGNVGNVVACQIKRWCCLISIPTCSVSPPCSLPCQGDCINAGTRDVYPFHWLDQFIPIEGVPSGLYWVEHVINPAGIFIESNYDNNSMMFQIELDQEAGRVRITQPPSDPAQCPAGTGLSE